MIGTRVEFRRGRIGWIDWLKEGFLVLEWAIRDGSGEIGGESYLLEGFWTSVKGR